MSLAQQTEIMQFTSSGTAADAYVSVGFLPRMAVLYTDVEGTNPNIRRWFNKRWLTEKTTANTSILDTGSTGVLSQDSASLTESAGGVLVTGADVTARKYFKKTGAVHVAGETTGKGIYIPAGDQANSGKNVLVCYR